MTNFNAKNVKAVVNGDLVEAGSITRREPRHSTVGVKVLITNKDPIELSVPFKGNLDQLSGDQFESFISLAGKFITDGNTLSKDVFEKCLERGYFYFIHNELN